MTLRNLFAAPVLTLALLGVSAFRSEVSQGEASPREPRLTGTISINGGKPGAKIPSSLYGIFLEEINNAGEGGLYAELVQNRGFEDANVPPSCSVQDGYLIPPRTPHYWEGKPSAWKMPWTTHTPYPGWSLVTTGGADAKISLTDDRPLNQATPHALRVDVTDLPAGGRATVVNEGFWGMSVRRGESYNVSFYVQADPSYRGPILASLIARDGRVLAGHRFDALPKGKWRKLTARLTATDTDAKGRLALSLGGKGTVYLDFVSLFPAKTFKNRSNGLRPDLAEMIADLKPAFVRYPGGCYVEGVTIETRPHWEETLGPLEQRVQTFSPWGYWSSNGFGYHEWLQFCEDIHADALYVFNAGISCAFRSGTYLPDSELPRLIQNTLDAIEYAVGPTDTKWGALRAKNGHPKPFPLKYVEIGNEDQGPGYGERVRRFYTAIKAKYPKIKVILSSWIAGIDQRAIDAAGKIDIVDEHAYTGNGWSVANFDSFAKYPRSVDWELYIGEFACNSGVGRGNLTATLNDAAYMMSMEKNADLVEMGSYAPLLENVNRREWDVNLIHFESSRVFGRASYYACKLFADNRPDINLETRVELADNGPAPISGPIGLGTFASAVEFKDVRVEQEGRAIYTSDFAKGAEGWSRQSGDWSVADGSYRQSNLDAREIWSFFGNDYKNVTLTLKARKVSGDEGFLVSIGNADGRRVQFNFGGWGNGLHAVQVNSGSPIVQRRGHIETGRWYDVKIQTDDRTARAYLDGTLVLETSIARARPVLAIAGREERAGDVVLKVVNSATSPAAMTVRLDGMRGLAPAAEATVLTSPSPTDENSFDEPRKIVPVTKSVARVGARFSYEFPPSSLTILRFQTRRRRTSARPMDPRNRPAFAPRSAH